MNKHKEGGFIKAIIVIVIALIILGYYGFNVRQIISSTAVRDNLSLAKEVSVNVWNLYLKGPITELWGAVLKSAENK